MIPSITIPFPPSVNHYYKRTRKGMTLGARGKLHRGLTWLLCRNNKIQPTRKRLAVTFICHRPDKRRRDLDNLLKCLQDSLTKGGAWHDDAQIVDLRILWVNEQPEEFMTFEVKNEDDEDKT